MLHNRDPHPAQKRVWSWHQEKKNNMVYSNQKIWCLCDRDSAATSQQLPKHCCLPSAIKGTATETYGLPLSGSDFQALLFWFLFFSSFKGQSEEPVTHGHTWTQVSLCSEWIHTCAYFISIKLTCHRTYSIKKPFVSVRKPCYFAANELHKLND